MASPDSAGDDKALFALRLIVFALAGGCLVFLAVVFWLRASKGETDEPDTLLFTYIGAALAAMTAAMRAILPGLITAQGRRALARDASAEPEAAQVRARLLMLFQQRTIVAAALLEGAGLMCCVAYLLEGTVLSLVLALALPAAILILQPGRGNLEEWVEEQERMLREETLDTRR